MQSGVIRKPEEFDPRLLSHEFNPLLVTDFQSETNPDDNYLSDYIRVHGQYHDMFLAYAYGLEVLAEIRRIGIKAITPAMVLRWIKESHRLIAHHLLEGVPVAAGDYTHIPVNRWHWGAPTQGVVAAFLSGDDSSEATITALALNANYPKDKLAKVMAMLRRARTIAIEPVRLAMFKKLCAAMNQTFSLGDYILESIIATRNLSKEDLSYFDDMMTRTMLPDKIPGAMEGYAAELVQLWRVCSKDNDEQVSELMYVAQRGLGSSIHPFANANGREATWLMNIIARSLELPSFLMRNKTDKNNPDSSYSVAIATFDSQPEHFKKHVLRQMKACDQTVTDESCKLIVEHVRNLQVVKEYKRKYPEAVLNRLLQKGTSKIWKDLKSEYGSERVKNRDTSVMLSGKPIEHKMLMEIPATIASLQKPQAQPQISKPAATSAVTQKTYTAEELRIIKDTLCKLSGHDTWKLHNTPEGVKAALALEGADEASAIAIIEKLNASGAMKAAKKRVTATKQLMVIAAQFNTAKLAAIPEARQKILAQTAKK